MALSLCEAEIVATNKCITELMHMRNRAGDLGMVDVLLSTPVYNDNQAAVNWAGAVTNKKSKHINLRKNKVPQGV